MKKVFLLSMLLLCVFISLIACADTSDTSSAVTKSTVAMTTTAGANESTTTALTTLMEVKQPPVLLYSEKTVSEKGTITLTSLSSISGTLLNITSDRPYRYHLPSLTPTSEIPGSVSQIKSQNLIKLYGNKSQNYVLKSASLFMKSDAFPYWEDMIADFSEASGKKSLQVVNAYLYSDSSSLNNEFVTGYCLAVNLFENGSTYSLNDYNQAFSYQNKTVTPEQWFIENCASYGFVYTGLTGTASQMLATFRFVGIAHALAMEKYDIIDMDLYHRIIKLSDNEITVKDSKTGYTWTIIYRESNQNSENTKINLPVGAVYTVSGDNSQGFILAYRLP